MEYESVKDASVRYGVSERAVQKWAKQGRIAGAVKIGRSWFIPKDAVLTEDVSELKMTEEKSDDNRIPMPLLNSSFEIGKCLEYINEIPDEDYRNIALGEYYYFSGHAEKSVEVVEKYLDSGDESLRYSSNLLCVFANLSLGRIHLAEFAIKNLKEQLINGLMKESIPQLHAMGIFTATAAAVLLHIPAINTPPLEDYIRYLPGGLKLYAYYILAHKIYLDGNYERSLAVADMALSMYPERYPISEIYLYIVAAMDLMSLLKVDEAKKRLMQAWEIARKDGFLEPFGEHHGLLQGLIEVCFKRDHPQLFEQIISITYAFSAGWRRIHNPETNDDVADNLTTTEFTIAMLYNRGWTIKEVASHMEISERTVKKHLSIIYEKLGITNRKELMQFMLR